MTADRISALLDPFLTHPLSESQLNQISIYIDLLQRWNARINLTAIRNEEEIVTRHFGESLFLARHLFSPIDCHPERSHVIREADGEAESKDPYSTSKLSPAKDPRGPTGNWQPATGNRVLDIGSGAGFPALPLKIRAPQIHLNLIESNHKKSAFLKEVSRALTFTNINVITERAETILTRRDHPQAEVVTLRAVEHFETILPQAATFLAAKATLALLIGTSQLRSLAVQTTLNWQPPIPIPSSNTRVLVLGCRQELK